MVNPKHRLLNHSKTIVNPTEECKQKINNLGVYSKTIVNPNKHIVNHEKKHNGKSMRNHARAMANSGKHMVKHIKKTW